MPEYSIVEGLTTGLRRDSRQNRNQQGLVEMSNLIPTEWGAKQVPRSIAIPTGSNPLNYPSISVTWPFPMVVHDSNNVLLCDRNAIYDGMGGTAISLVGSYSLNSGANDTWEMASFEKDIWFLANGTYMVYKIPSNLSGHADVVDGWRPRTVANYAGRLFLGGLGGTLPTKLTDFFAEWKKMDHAAARTIGKNTSLNDSWLIYSKVGGGARDVPFLDFMSMLDEYGGNTISSDLKADMNVLIRNSLESGDIGFFPIRNKGTIYSIRPIGDLLMVYTDRGVSRVRMTEEGLVEDQVSNVGVITRHQVGGDMYEHIFVDDTSNLNRVDENGNVSRIGYDEFMIFVSGTGMLISVDPLERFYSISDGTYGFMLTRTGLSKTPCMMPTSLWRSGTLRGPTIETTGTAATIETDIFDGGYRGVHEIVFVRIATTDTIGWTVAAKWRMNKDDNFTTETAVAFDDRGVARVKTSGIEFKLLLTASNRALADLERIEIELRQGGKKKLRQLV